MSGMQMLSIKQSVIFL